MPSKPTASKSCAECGAAFVGYTSRRYCRDECRLARQARQQQEKVAAALASATKSCCRCDRVLAKTEFHDDPQRFDGLYPYCKECRSGYAGVARRPTDWGIRTAEERAERKRQRERDRLAAMSASERSEKARHSRLWSFYRLTVADYQALLAAQGGVCAVCKRAETRSSSKFGNAAWLAVDHDHRCCPGDRSCGNCVRGLLCMACNVSIGAMGDDPDRLLAASLYLEAWQLDVVASAA